MKKTLLAFASLLALTAPALAQPIESEPLAPYTLSTETDPMATTPPPSDVGSTAALPATPPPGADDLPTQDVAPIDTGPAQTTSIDPAMPSNPPDPAPYQPTPLPEGSLAGTAPREQPVPQNRKFCTAKVSFASMGTGIDSKTSDKVKNYLDANTGKLTYFQSNWGKEGERDYCLDIPEHRERAQIYKDLKRLLPDRSQATAPITLTGKGFETITVKK